EGLPGGRPEGRGERRRLGRRGGRRGLTKLLPTCRKAVYERASMAHRPSLRCSFHRSLRLAGAVASLALLVFGCGNASWTPPPAPIIPVAPGPTSQEEEAGSALEALAAAGGVPIASTAPASTAVASAAPKAPSPLPGELPSDLDGKLAANASCS